jgi:hypothetical protein
MEHFCIKINEFGVKGVSGFVPFPCQTGGTGVEMRVLVRILPILLFPDRFKVKTIPIKAKKGVEKLPLKN